MKFAPCPVFIQVTPNIASRFTAAKRHTVVIAYVPVAWPLNPPPLGQSYLTTREAQSIKMWICGPRHNNTCIPGARTTVLPNNIDCCLIFFFLVPLCSQCHNYVSCRACVEKSGCLQDSLEELKFA